MYIKCNTYRKKDYRLKSFTNPQRNVSSHRHDLLCLVSVLCVFVLTVSAVANCVETGELLRNTACETTLKLSGFELPDDAASRPRQIQINSSGAKNIFPAGTLPEFLQGFFLPFQYFSSSTIPVRNAFVFVLQNLLTPAAPVRAGPQRG